MSDQISKHDHVLLALTMNLQAMAMVQLGKVTNPVTGEMERDLDGARGSIDILEMLKQKCRSDTPESVLQVLDRAVMELQMNYLDEVKRQDAAGDDAAEAAAEAAGDDATAETGEATEEEEAGE
jgi:hypothetical protein